VREQYSTGLAVMTGALILIVTTVIAFFQSPWLLDFPATAVVKSAGEIPHPIVEREDCAGCHAIGGVKPYPVKHAGWSIRSCTRCHGPVDAAAQDTVAVVTGSAERPGTAPPVPHPVEGMEDCTACHGLEADLPYPEDHHGRADEGCTACHAAPENEGERGK
jgi:hypothetical protein